MSGPSVLEYARFHGLATDHTSDVLLEHLCHAPRLTAHCSTDLDSALPDPDLTAFARAVEEPKLELSRQGTILLAESITDHRPTTIQWSDFLPNPHRWRRLKVDEPLLAGDHDLEVAGFKQDAASRLDIRRLLRDTTQSNTTSIELYEEEWDDVQEARSLKDVKKAVDREKVHTTREALLCLAETRNGTLTRDERNAFLSTGVSLKPLLRSSSPLSMPDKSLPCSYTTSPSDTEVESPTEEEIDVDKLLPKLQELRHRETEGWSALRQKGRSDSAPPGGSPIPSLPVASVNIQNHSTLGEPHPSNDYATLRLVEMGAASPPEEMGQEGTPLSLPIKLASSPQQKPELPIEMKVTQTRNDCLSPRNKTSSPSQLPLRPSHDAGSKHDLDDDIDADFLIMAEQANEDMDNRLKHTTNGLSDVCTKVPVPALDFTRSRSADYVSPSGLVACHLDLVLQSAPDPAEGENGVDWELEQSAIPLYHMSVNPEERIEACDIAQEIAEPPQGIIRSEQMLWKSPGLRILDENEESDDEMEEDIDLAATVSMPSMPQLPMKRPVSDECTTFSFAIKKPRSTDQDNRAGLLQAKCASSTLPSPFSASGALETFLDLRGSKFKAVKQPCQSSMEEIMEDPIEATQLAQKDDSEYAQETAIVLVPATPALTARPAPGSVHPPHSSLKWCRTVVVDMAMLRTCRHLLDFLERQGSGQLTMIYRDLTSGQCQVEKISSASPDMILNPRTGLIFTNLQALNQKSLPGQGDSTNLGMVQTRILRLLQDYDEVFILVTVPRGPGSLSPTTADAISQFSGFCSSLSTRNRSSVTPVWIPAQLPSQAVDATWANMSWQLIVRHAFPTSPPKQDSTGSLETVKLLHDETLWELFLRKAGMNAMAAQVVLGMLHRFHPPGREIRQSWGLRRLVQMKAEERIAMFSEILGRSMTERMNTMLEAPLGVK